MALLSSAGRYRPGRDRGLASLIGLAAPLAWLMLVAILLSGCDPYDPELGDRPFQCGALEPRCPDGYTCVVLSPREAVCDREGAVAPDAGSASVDAAPFLCADDGAIEPNDRVVLATPTSIPDAANTYDREELAICPTADVDLFELAVTAPGSDVVTEIEFQAIHGSLILDVVNAAGGEVGTSAVVDGDPGHLRAVIRDAQPALYYARIQAAVQGIRNNYDLRVTVAPPASDTRKAEKQ